MIVACKTKLDNIYEKKVEAPSVADAKKEKTLLNFS